MNALIFLGPLLDSQLDKVPASDDVKAGWGAFALFIALAVAVAFLGWSMARHLRKARNNAERGVFDPSDEPRPHRS